ncbi:hypothetical protein BS78_08G122300 [Paspalum vaginatum]|nr:hypothetical protein BS78_08G122300 [Paspalum vaginatum]
MMGLYLDDGPVFGRVVCLLYFIGGRILIYRPESRAILRLESRDCWSEPPRSESWDRCYGSCFGLGALLGEKRKLNMAETRNDSVTAQYRKARGSHMLRV